MAKKKASKPFVGEIPLYPVPIVNKKEIPLNQLPLKTWIQVYGNKQTIHGSETLASAVKILRTVAADKILFIFRIDIMADDLAIDNDFFIQVGEPSTTVNYNSPQIIYAGFNTLNQNLSKSVEFEVPFMAFSGETIKLYTSVAHLYIWNLVCYEVDKQFFLNSWNLSTPYQ